MLNHEKTTGFVWRKYKKFSSYIVRRGCIVMHHYNLPLSCVTMYATYLHYQNSQK